MRTKSDYSKLIGMCSIQEIWKCKFSKSALSCNTNRYRLTVSLNWELNLYRLDWVENLIDIDGDISSDLDWSGSSTFATRIVALWGTAGLSLCLLTSFTWYQWRAIDRSKAQNLKVLVNFAVIIFFCIFPFPQFFDRSTYKNKLTIFVDISKHFL